jgi:hypothetical protein
MKNQIRTQPAKSSQSTNNSDQVDRRLDDEQAAELLKNLDAQSALSGWKGILLAFAETGVLNTSQIQSIVKQDAVSAKRLMERINKTCGDLPPICRLLERSPIRPGFSGRPSRIYLLDEGGAAVLHQMGRQDAHACGLLGDVSILHALAMSDIYLAAKSADLEIITDRTLPFEPRRVLRPDHQIKLSDTRQALFEVEQSANVHNLRRIIESLQNKADFFQSPQAKNICQEVRMLVHLPRGKEFEKTVQIWRKAAREVWKGSKANFRLMAIPILEFLDQPEWESTQKLGWVDVLEESNLMIYQPGTQPSKNQLNKMSYGKANLDRVVLSALWQEFQKNAQDVVLEPSPDFFELMALIYAASHHESNSAIKNAAYPKASIYLLGEYLSMHPNLRELLRKTIRRGQSVMRWNQTTIVHRMQGVVQAFLGYHGFRPYGTLYVNAFVRSWNDGPGPVFDIRVFIRDPFLLVDKQEQYQLQPDDETVAYYATALRWVLRALFDYSEKIGLGIIDFA